MRGLGTVVNVAAVILGSLIGLMLRSGMSERFKNILQKACGLAVIFIGGSSVLSGMLKVNADGSLRSEGGILLVISLVLGGLCGEAVNIEKRLDTFGEWLRKKARATGDAGFVDGFVNASLLICVGAMSVVGSIEDGLTGNAATLLTKSVLDFVMVIVMSSSLGIGVMFSALTVAVYQGLLTGFAVLIEPLLTDVLIADISFVGASLVFAVGVNLAFGKKFRVGNYLPALLVPIGYEVIKSLIG